MKQEMGMVREILERLNEANEESKSLHNPEALKSIQSQINADIIDLLKLVRAIKSKLKNMYCTNAANLQAINRGLLCTRPGQWSQMGRLRGPSS